MVDIKRLRRFTFLSSLSDDELGVWLPRFAEKQIPRNEFVFREGDPFDGIYLVEAGQLAAYKRLDEGGDQLLGYYLPGDFCGADAIFDDDVHGMTLRTSTQSALLFIPRADVEELLDTHPRALSDLRNINARQRKRYLAHFNGKRPDEAMLVFDHHHRIGLVPWVGGALLILAAVLVGPALLNMPVPLWAYGLALAGFIAAMVLLYIDWQGDWFIVTSKRIIHRDAVFGVFNEVQEEAPLEMVQNVTTDIDSFLENLLSYGDVIIQTAGGKVSFQRVPHPTLTRDVILAEIQRMREHRRVDELSEIRKALRSAIKSPGEGGPPPPAPAQGPAQPTFVSRVANMFGSIQIIPPARLVKDNQTIWRKHILLLYGDIVLPLLGLLVLLPLSVFMIFGDIFGVRMPLLLTLLLATIGTPALIVWLFYRYRDWENDIYVLTPDQLIDSERKPFWLEEKVKVVGLGQVQNVRFERSNLLQNLFNFGTVIVQTAGQDSSLVFENIPGPRAVEEEVLDALERFKEKQRERERVQRRREFQDWFTEYHKLKAEDTNTPAPP
jgi:membrane protein YdbS with pleckstrin-like domain